MIESVIVKLLLSALGASLKQTFFVTLPDRFVGFDNSYVLRLSANRCRYLLSAKTRAALNIKNFDVEYFTGSDGGRVQFNCAPLTVLGTRWSFDMQLRKKVVIYTAI